MFGIFRRRRPHPHARELGGLIACVIAWRRANLEHWLRSGEADAKMLEESRQTLRWYATASGAADPFGQSILDIPVGALDEGLFLEASYRIETAGALAWSLGLLVRLPTAEERIDHRLLEELVPEQDGPAPAFREAQLRDRAELEHALAEWRERTATARERRDAAPADPPAAFAFSRAYERARGIAWVLSSLDHVEDVRPD
jgi:hypothetical protein